MRVFSPARDRRDFTAGLSRSSAEMRFMHCQGAFDRPALAFDSDCLALRLQALWFNFTDSDFWQPE